MLLNSLFDLQVVCASLSLSLSLSLFLCACMCVHVCACMRVHFCVCVRACACVCVLCVVLCVVCCVCVCVCVLCVRVCAGDELLAGQDVTQDIADIARVHAHAACGDELRPGTPAGHRCVLGGAPPQRVREKISEPQALWFESRGRFLSGLGVVIFGDFSMRVMCMISFCITGLDVIVGAWWCHIRGVWSSWSSVCRVVLCTDGRETTRLCHVRLCACACGRDVHTRVCV